MGRRGSATTAGVYVTKSVAEKMGIKAGQRPFLLDAPADAVEALDLAALRVASELRGEFDYIHVFVETQASFEVTFSAVRAHLAGRGSLWVSWPKNRQRGTDLTMARIISIGYRHAMVESKAVSVDATWSALKFTHPKPRKVYANSYGERREAEPKPIDDRARSLPGGDSHRDETGIFTRSNRRVGRQHFAATSPRDVR